MDPLEISVDDQKCNGNKTSDIINIIIDHCYSKTDCPQEAKRARIDNQESSNGSNYPYSNFDNDVFSPDWFPANNDVQVQEVEISGEVTNEVDPKIRSLEAKVALLEKRVKKITEENLQLNSVIVRVQSVLTNIDEFV